MKKEDDDQIKWQREVIRDEWLEKVENWARAINDTWMEKDDEFLQGIDKRAAD